MGRLDIDRTTAGERDRRAVHRARRVVVLIGGILLLSFGDLLVTLEHLQTIGMAEANPIAAWLIRATQSGWVLAAYKGLTVGVCVTLLYRVRRSWEGEAAAWSAVAILAAMTIVWHTYSEEIGTPRELLLVQAERGDQWLHLD